MDASLQAIRPTQLLTGPGVFFREKVEDFLRAQDIRELSKEVYRKGLYRFLDWAERNVSGTLQRQHILDYKTYLLEIKLSINSCNSALTALRCFFQWLDAAEGITRDITKGIRGFRQHTKKHLRDALSAAQVRQISDLIARDSEQGARDFAIFTLLARTGIRTIEVARSCIEDIRQADGEGLLSVMRKGHFSKDDEVLLMPEVLQALSAYLRKYRKGARPSDPLFLSCSDKNRGAPITTATVRFMVKRYLREIGVDSPRLSAHSVRHFFATAALKNGAELMQVRDSLGHCSVETTQKYLHNLDRIEKAAERFVSY